MQQRTIGGHTVPAIGLDSCSPAHCMSTARESTACSS